MAAQMNIATVPDANAVVPVTLHPLVVLNISDHYTRQSIQANVPRAIGLVLGQLSGKVIEITNSIDVAFGVKDGNVVLDESHIDLLTQRRSLYQTTFPELDVVGWYSTGLTVSAVEMQSIHGKLMKTLAVESPLILVVDPTPPPSQRKLPVWVVEQRRSESGASTLVKVPYDIESEAAERIGIDTAMKVDENAGSNAGLGPQALRLLDAVDALNTRIKVVVAYLDAVQKGRVPPDYELIRRISEVVNQLPRSDVPRLNEILEADKRDALIIAFLGVVAKGSAQLSKLSMDSNTMRDLYAGSRRSLRANLAAQGI